MPGLNEFRNTIRHRYRRIMLVIILAVLLVEIAGFFYLYATNQIYHTLPVYLMRFLIVPTILDFAAYFICLYVMKNNPNDTLKQDYALIIALLFVATVVGMTHNVYHDTMMVYLLPIFMCTVSNEKKLLNLTVTASIIGETAIIIWRDIDQRSQHRPDPNLLQEAVIAYVLIIVAGGIASGIVQLFAEQKQLEAEKEKAEASEEMSIQLIQTLTGTIDAKDEYTKGHSTRVAYYSVQIARKAGFSELELKKIYIAGLLHDVGKIKIPDSIINKKGRLTKEEFDVIKEHPMAGYRILKNLKDYDYCADTARWHHERYDGTGYPDGRSGFDIPALARITAVADAYDAMTSDRSYRSALPQATVRDEIEKNSGSQFDPFFAEIMLEMIDEDKDYGLRQHGNAFERQS